jgi:hypothetical protein
VPPHDPQPDPIACTFSADPAHPDRLRCDACGGVIGAIDPCADPGDPPPLVLTAHQAALRWPELAEAVREHAVVCRWRRNPPPAEGWHVHLYPGEGGEP